MMELLETLGEPDELTLLQLSAARARKALQEAPGLVTWVRLQVVPAMGGVSDGMPRAASKTPPAPMRVDAVDTADEVYSQLLDWASYWSNEFEIGMPSTAVVAWQNRAKGEPMGFKASATPEGAGMLTRNVCTFLLVNHTRIAGHMAATTYFDDVSGFVGKAAGRFPRKQRKDRGVVGRRCPVCGEFQVHGVWRSEDVRDVVVSCEHCGHTVEPKSYQRVLDWIS